MSTRGKDSKMNYLFICCDQLRYDTLSCHGNTVCSTPALDRLARMGCDCTNARTTAPLCSPARASMFTGRYALTHGMGTNCDMYHALSTELIDSGLLLHTELQKHGYKTGYVGKWHVGTKLGPVDYGFDGMNVPGYGNCKVYDKYLQYLLTNNLEYKLTNKVYLNPNEKTLVAAHWEGPEESTTDYFLTQQAIQLMDEYEELGSPWFVTLQYWGPHSPHTPPSSFIGKADRSKIGEWPNFRENLADKPEFVSRHKHFYRSSPATWDGCREIIGMYYDYMMFIDKLIGEVITYLEQRQLLETTTIVFTSDHGDLLWSHDGLIDKGFLYEEAMHIPLMYYRPETKLEKTSNALVSNMDILYTIVKEVGGKLDHTDAIDLLPVIRGEEQGRYAFLMEFHGIHFLYTQRAVIDRDGHKFIWTPGDIDELYDLKNDPWEIDNLAQNPKFASIKETMISTLKQAVVQYRDPVMDYVYKIFGEWESPSGQIDASSSRYNVGNA